MSSFSQISPKDLVKALIKLDFCILRQKGSHIRLSHPNGCKLTVAIHSKPIPVGTLSNILRQANISREELEKVLR